MVTELRGCAVRCAAPRTAHRAPCTAAPCTAHCRTVHRRTRRGTPAPRGVDSHLTAEGVSAGRRALRRRPRWSAQRRSRGGPCRGRPCSGCSRGARQRGSWQRCSRAHPTHAARPTPPLTRRRSREAGIAAQKASAQADKARERKLQDEKLQEQRMEQRKRRLTKEGVLTSGS